MSILLVRKWVIDISIIDINMTTSQRNPGYAPELSMLIMTGIRTSYCHEVFNSALL